MSYSNASSFYQQLNSTDDGAESILDDRRSQVSQQTLNLFSITVQGTFSRPFHSSNQARENNLTTHKSLTTQEHEGDTTMKRLIIAGLSVAALSAIASAPASALTERFNDSYRDNLNKGLAADVNLTERHQESFNEGLYRLTDRFNDSYRDNLNKGLSTETNLSRRHQDSFNQGLNRLTDRHQDEFNEGLNRLTERFDDERDSTLNR